MMKWIKKSVRAEYEGAVKHPEYRHFLQGNFPELVDCFICDGCSDDQ